MKHIIAALLFILAGPAFGQIPPFVYPVTIGTAQVTILPANTARKKIIFQNSNATALVAVCPVGPSRSNGAAITAAINGPGCLTLLPYQNIEISGSTASGPQQSMPSAWIGIASAGGSSLSILEFE
jgi:hypothetical protein